ncbi:hypothetical protein LOTGIDRAFT_180290 [Lottia gigantea]|uniref:Glucosamine 6-phosphate N-acetyltransferase n=1 Tax=Lottia gigantea TaxID=225164 RepID=V4AC91_LOTGI|nr:hypothetical protein LOTGIDRAFT_180290 [Lottia gigantea]ESP01619.1 hypothetical protein LOTGIDRAFT_180290 [Lottia gigantea]
MEDDISLFDASILEEIDFSKCHGEYKPAISHKNPGSNLRLRPLSSGDFNRGFLKLLTQLTQVGEVSKKQFIERFNSMKASPGGYYILVLENTETEEVIASATLVVEFKFIHNAGARGRVEDVVVSKDYRGKQLGKLLLDCLTLLAPKVGCYKLSLECKDPLVDFYTTFGFSKEAQQNYLVQRFWD